MKRQCWRPDWQQDSEYPQPENTSPEQWGWEFLRRNPEYQRLWLRILQCRERHTSIQDDEHAFDSTPESSTVLSRQFHLSGLPPDPSQAVANPGLFQTEFVQYEASSDQPATIMSRLEPNQMVFWLNIEWPIEPQLASAKAIFKAEREKRNLRPRDWRNRVDKYKTYLRILDALEAKATADQIGCALYPKLPRESQLQRVRDDITASRRLRDHDYWRIALTRAKK